MTKVLSTIFMDKIYLYIWRKKFTRYEEKMLPLSI